ncbi:deubiquitinase OTUD6B-like [Macrobrachium nipponense]|uniref:deubiquitinase OTUD6B-like n=1 Tax=Macrobrachium nipponense TaxID=159736 RepID=UPI0030C7F829
MMEEEIQEGTSAAEEILARQRKEKKELQAKIQQLKKSINKDKKKKKEITAEIARLEQEQQSRHSEELAAIGHKEGLEGQQEESNDTEISTEVTEQESEVDSTEGHGTQGPEKKMSKAAKRRQKKADANRAREALIREEKENNRFCARNVEAAKLKALLKARKLKMFEIKPDGDCMYAAMAHQMTDVTVSWLRSKASQYIRLHSDDFGPFITNPDTGEQLTPEEFEEYCDQIENTNAWGGQPELRALSQVLKRKIEVLQAEGSPIIFGECCNEEKPIILTYYRHCYGLGEHYNSVAVLTGEEVEDENDDET